MATVTVLGLAYESNITQFPVRTGPGTNHAYAPFKVSKGTSGLMVLDVQEDSKDTMSDFGRIYSWFKLKFPDGQEGWLRGHIVGIEGDFSEWGYGFVAPIKHAYLLTRDLAMAAKVQQQKAAAAAAATAATTTTTTEPDASTEKSPASTEPTASTETSPATTEPDASTETSSSEDTEASTRPVRQVSEAGKKTAVVSKPQGPPTVTVQRPAGTALNVRDNIAGANVLFRIPAGESATIVEIGQQSFGQKFPWYKVNYNGQQGWLRGDFVSYTGDTEALGLPWDLYPSPLKNKSWWVRDFNYKPNQDTTTWEHWGWDFGSTVGTPIYCGPFGGRVVQVLDCTKCTAAQPSTVSQNIDIGSLSVIGDPAWGFGYGNAVIMGYDWDILPDSSKAWMSQNNYTDGSIFVLYGHLHERKVSTGMTLDAEQIIATCGNTGNSEAPHLHLEVRVSKTSSYSSWSGVGVSNLVNPSLLFHR